MRGLEALEPRRLLAFTTPVISEFLATNTNGLKDEDGDKEDWVEIHNPTTSSVNLGGYFLTDDVRDDITRFEPFFASAIRVIDLDRKRDASMHYMTELSPREKADAVARMQENSLIVQWVQICLEQRVSSYRWALERLVLQAPDSIAAEADRLIGELAAQTANPPVAARPLIQRPLTSKG